MADGQRLDAGRSHRRRDPGPRGAGHHGRGSRGSAPADASPAELAEGPAQQLGSPDEPLEPVGARLQSRSPARDALPPGNEAAELADDDGRAVLERRRGAVARRAVAASRQAARGPRAARLAALLRQARARRDLARERRGPARLFGPRRPRAPGEGERRARHRRALRGSALRITRRRRFGGAPERTRSGLRALRSLLASLILLHAALASAQQPGYDQRKEVKQFIAEMVKKHKFTSRQLTRVFAQAQYQPSIVRAMDQPPESALASWQAYRAIFLKPERVEAGAQFWTRHAEALKRASAEYGVPEDIIVGIIGVETIFGRNIGTYRVIDALTTLAFDYPKRSAYFRGELEHYLVFSRDQKIDPLRVKGSYAGAIGIPQFMPGSYRRFAVDFDGDGQINLATNPTDAIGSIGNFLKSHGWVRGEPVALGAQVSGDGWRKLAGAGIVPATRLSDLPEYGVKAAADLPGDTLCALVELESPGQPSDIRVTLKNFFVLTRYNRSNLYAAAVLDLAAEIARARSAAAKSSP